MLDRLFKNSLPNFITNRQKTGFSSPIDTYYTELLSKYDVWDCISDIKKVLDNEDYIYKIERYLKTKNDIQTKFKVVLLAIWIKKHVQVKL